MSNDLGKDRDKAVADKYQESIDYIWRIGDAEFDPSKSQITLNGESVNISGSDPKILRWLIAWYPHAAERQFLIEKAIAGAEKADPTLTNAISRIRQCLGGKKPIKTLQGVGYQLVEEPERLSSIGAVSQAPPPVAEPPPPADASTYRAKPQYVRGLAMAGAAALLMLVGSGYWLYSRSPEPSNRRPLTGARTLAEPSQSASEEPGSHAPKSHAADWFLQYVVAQGAKRQPSAGYWHGLREQVDQYIGGQFESAYGMFTLYQTTFDPEKESPAYRHALDAALVISAAASTRFESFEPRANRSFISARNGLHRLSSLDDSAGRRLYVSAAIAYWFFLRDRMDASALSQAAAQLAPEARRLFGADSPEHLAATGLLGISDLRAGRNNRAFNEISTAFDGLSHEKEKSLWKAARFAPALGQAALATGQCDQVMPQLERADESERYAYQAYLVKGPWVQTRFARVHCTLALGRTAKAKALLKDLIEDPTTQGNEDVVRPAKKMLAKIGDGS